tara:strand:- start:1842 stop:3212 length:1371 start_codon:yes stop_codon:yes gene_type:complete
VLFQVIRLQFSGEFMQNNEDGEQPVSGDVGSKPPASTGAMPQESAWRIRNFAILAVHHISLRCGWIFKTESIIMPAVVDSLGGAAWLRGCLPLLNRFGQSVPPLLMSGRIKGMAEKKWAMAVCATCMSVCFLTLALVWYGTGQSNHGWMAPAFLGIYGIFFISTGVYNMTFTTVQGKLVQTNRRGRLLLISNLVGAVVAIVSAALLLPLWLQPGEEQFGLIFGFSGVMFAIAALLSLLLAEPRDDFSRDARPSRLLQQAVGVLRRDRDFRRLALIGALFGTCFTLFPHYQSIGRGLFPDQGLNVLISWVMVQNGGTACASLVAGPLADRFGNRLALRVLLLLICVAPFLTLALRILGPEFRESYNVVFILVGLTPTFFRIINNFTLELSKPEDHPVYISTLSLCIAAPAITSPLVGLVVDRAGFAPVFLTIGSVLVFAWLLTFTLSEPRHDADNEL